MLSVEDYKSLKEAQDQKFNRLDLSKILKGSHEMLCAAKVEPTQMQTVNDLVQSLFTHHTRAHFFFNAMVFLANTVALLT
jgi:hypothetical protein